jgi:hypothetical protein
MSTVNKAIRHLGLRVIQGEGYVYWEDAETRELRSECPSVYVNKIRDLSIEQWVREAEYALQEEKEEKERWNLL